MIRTLRLVRNKSCGGSWGHSKMGVQTFIDGKGHELPLPAALDDDKY